MNQTNSATAAEKVPAEVFVAQLAFGALLSQALFVAAKLGIADLLASGPKPVGELAAATKTHEQSLFRVLRSLATTGIFEETGSRLFALTDKAQPLRSDVPNSMRSGVIFMGEDWHWRVWGNMIQSVENGETAWSKVHGQEVFDYFQSNSQHYEIFNRAMTDLTASTAPAIVAAFDFGNFNTLVDVAGGHGYLLSEILNANPNLQGVLFDVPAVIDTADELLRKRGASNRIKKVAGNFFEAIPSADAYMLKHIIHDWDDDRAAKILQNIAAAMLPSAKVLIVESVVPEGNDPHFSKVMDLEMLISPGGMERTGPEYETLLSRAGLRLTRIVPTQTAYSIIEAVKKGEEMP
jgi:hypothetical protein